MVQKTNRIQEVVSVRARKPIVAGNWKMNKSIEEAIDLASSIKIDLATCVAVDVVLCPPFTALKVVGDILTGTHMQLGAQTMHWENSGAYTGEISPGMLRDIFCHYVIIGHSERRAYFHESNKVINRKIKAALASALRPILCVGETHEEHEDGKTEAIVRTQLKQGLAGLDEDIMQNVIIAYEPVWAIGTGLTATPEQAQQVHAFIRDNIASQFTDAVAKSIRIQYGGSVKPNNARELFSQPDIDGGLIGGAALDARSFIEIVNAAL
ncbi:MAG: triose-phosphate isomerase [Proteobacteria bacterium]|nr:triose-phosphate isomerase [Pseudomonadota bacterium]